MPAEHSLLIAIIPLTHSELGRGEWLVRSHVQSHHTNELFTQLYFQLKMENILCILVIHLHNNGFWGAENINFLKTGFKVQKKYRYYLCINYKNVNLWKQRSPVHTCFHHHMLWCRRMLMCAGVKCFFTKWHCLCLKFFQKRKEKTSSFLVHYWHENIP